MIYDLKFSAVAAAMSLLLASGASATTYVIHDGIAAGRADFDATVASAGGTVTVDTWDTLNPGPSINRGDYTITRNNGANFFGGASYGTLSGLVFAVTPALNSGASEPIGGRADPMDYFNSGVTLTFNDTINSIGFEIGNWATCCFDPVTELFVSFDGGTPILVGSATQPSDGLFPSQRFPNISRHEIFVGALDDSGGFNTVSFWGNGTGEILGFGGEVRYALIDQGSLSPPSPIPLPATGFLLMGGLVGLAGLRRRRKA